MELFGLAIFIVLTIVLALAFDFVNGFHDAANAIATVVATKVLTPVQAVVMAGFFNFVGPFVFTLAVANTVGKGIIEVGAIDSSVFVEVIFGALMGAFVWDLITWYFGLPTSSSHALVGGLIGAALSASGSAGIVMPKWSEWSSTVDSLTNGGTFTKWGVIEYIVIGALLGLLSGLVAWGWSRVKVPRVAFWVFAVAGLVGGLLIGLNAGHVDNWLSKEAFEGALLLVSFGFMGTVAGVLVWAMSQQKMNLKNLPVFALFGSAVALVTVTLTGSLKMGGISKTLVFMIVSPMLGFLSGFLLASAMSWTVRKEQPAKVSAWSRRLQLASAAFYALTHGTNDAQKTMGIIGVLLFGVGVVGLDATGNLDIPTWVILTSAAAMGLGTMFGGWRIVQTMASKLTHLRPYQGFAAETGGGVVLVAMAQAGIPVSTTHAITSSIMGVGATRRASAVRWGTGRRIMAAWVITIPASAVIGALTFWVVHLL